MKVVERFIYHRVSGNFCSQTRLILNRHTVLIRKPHSFCLFCHHFEYNDARAGRNLSCVIIGPLLRDKYIQFG